MGSVVLDDNTSKNGTPEIQYPGLPCWGLAIEVTLYAGKPNAIESTMNSTVILHVCRFIGKTNAILCDFGCCDSSTLGNIHITFCMDLYGCELWNISSKYTKEMHTAWRIAMRKIWKLHPRTHNNLNCNIISNFTHSLKKRHISFVYNALLHPNELVRLLLHVKLASANSVFAENCRYLSFKYQITREDWNKPHSF